jgi:hypothetical protein
MRATKRAQCPDNAWDLKTEVKQINGLIAVVVSRVAGLPEGKMATNVTTNPLHHLEEGLMKRKLNLLFAVILVFAVAGQAAAFFEKGNLVQVVYKDSDKETLTDLLNTTTFNWNTPGTTILTAAGTFPGFTAPFSALSGSFFATKTGGGIGEAWFATTQTTAPGVSSSSLGAFIGGATKIQGAADDQGLRTITWNYSDLVDDDGNPSTPPVPAINASAYDRVFNSNSNAPGLFAGYTANPGISEVSLAGLATEDYVSMYLYKYNLSLLVESPLGTPYMGELRLFADGHTEINVNAVPIPAAAWLLATGLVGLVGIRRRRSK